jgi:CRP-like cAMP-binding protein
MSLEDAHISRATWRSQSILRHLDNDELIYLEDMSEIINFKKNDVIFVEGKCITGCYVMLSGIVKQFKTGLEGRNYILRLAKPFEILGFRSALSEEPACTTTIVIEGCTVCYIPKECLHHLVKTNGNFALDLLQIACRELEHSHSILTEIAQKSAKARLAELLLTLKNRFGEDENGYLNILLSREEYANIVGTATESIIRLLSEFKSERFIDLDVKKVKILNDKALENISKIQKIPQ